MIESGWTLVIVALIGVPFICWVVYVAFKEAPIDIATRRAREAMPARSTATSSPTPVPRPGSTNPVIAWNVVVFVAGVFIALIGLWNGLAANPENSALRQTVAALWVIQGLLGLLIAAVGIRRDDRERNRQGESRDLKPARPQLWTNAAVRLNHRRRSKSWQAASRQRASRP